MMTPLFKTSMAAGAAVGAASLSLGQVIDVQLSGAQVVGYAVGVVGFLIAGLISLVTWFAGRELKKIRDTQEAQGKTLEMQDRSLFKIETKVDAITAWKEERQEALRQQEADKLRVDSRK